MQLNTVKQNISQSETLPADFYSDTHLWEAMKEKVFAPSWQYLGDQQQFFGGQETTYPITLLDKYLDEPLLLTKDAEGQLHCLSNVCTHRGFLLAQHPSKDRKITCGYHGRRFNLAGKMEFMPEFKDAENFPRPCDHLHELPLKRWRQFLFTSLDPKIDWAEITQELDRRLSFLPLEHFRYAPEYSTEYMVHAHWALYCDNYLEGFHIPFVHHQLNQMLDYGAYDTEIFPHMNLQIGYSSVEGEHFDLPAAHPDYGKKITAFYYWIYPNLMLNFYPWGLSINVVRPLNPSLSRISFITYLYDEKKFLEMDAAALTDKVEREDEFVVEAVQKGLRSRFYKTGRFSPRREKGVHHFHGLLQQATTLEMRP
ncbi:MAG: aromatic ring-hydroxylating dioxygenase subunit alpha [Saprospiraceae bacterium]|nr:aromatic ring-hydroxylating dioxygenase subunit alpha [Saprospiraceae bacterium]